MITCKKCNFKIEVSMRYALMQNVCPSCGSHLFSEDEAKDLKILRDRVRSQSFSSGFSKEQIMDVAIFVFGEINNGYGNKVLQKKSVEMQNGNGSAKDSSVLPSEEAVTDEDLRKIRENIAKEIGAGVVEYDHEDDDDISEEVDFDSSSEENRIKRLKALAKKQNKSSGPMVRRLD